MYECVCFGGPTVWSSVGSSVNMAAQVKGEIECFSEWIECFSEWSDCFSEWSECFSEWIKCFSEWIECFSEWIECFSEWIECFGEWPSDARFGFAKTTDRLSLQISG